MARYVSTEYDQRIIDTIASLLRKANRKFHAKAYVDDVVISKALISKHGKAGWSNARGYYITLSYESLIDDTEEMFSNVIPHEVAHIVGYWLYHNDLPFGDTAHGENWLAIAKYLGSTGELRGNSTWFTYMTSDGKEKVYVSQKEHHDMQDKFKTFKTKSGRRLTASGFVGIGKK